MPVHTVGLSNPPHQDILRLQQTFVRAGALMTRAPALTFGLSIAQAAIVDSGYHGHIASYDVSELLFICNKKSLADMVAAK